MIMFNSYAKLPEGIPNWPLYCSSFRTKVTLNVQEPWKSIRKPRVPFTTKREQLMFGNGNLFLCCRNKGADLRCWVAFEIEHIFQWEFPDPIDGGSVPCFWPYFFYIGLRFGRYLQSSSVPVAWPVNVGYLYVCLLEIDQWVSPWRLLWMVVPSGFQEGHDFLSGVDILHTYPYMSIHMHTYAQLHIIPSIYHYISPCMAIYHYHVEYIIHQNGSILMDNGNQSINDWGCFQKTLPCLWKTSFQHDCHTLW